MAHRLTKVRFELDVSDWHGHGSETLWAKPIREGDYRIVEIKNSPFFAKGINNRDVVRATSTDNDLVFGFTEIIERGGHSTYMLLMQPADTRIATFWKILEKLGCSYESMSIVLSIGSRLLYSVDVPSAADLYEVHETLERGKNEGVWVFQEGFANIPAVRRRFRSPDIE